MIKKVIAKNNELTSEDGEEKPKGDIILKIVAYSLKGKEQGCLETACCGRTDNILSACVHATVSVLNFAAKDAEGFRNTKKAFIDSLEELAIYREESGCDNAGE
jgi:L-asparaginase II